MESHPTTSPPSIRISECNSPHDDAASGANRSSRSSSIRESLDHSLHSPSASSTTSLSPMTIPSVSSGEALAPPPLPPPRFIEDLAHGHDSGWKWGNSSEHDQFGQSSTLAPIKPTSSLLGGGNTRPPLVRRDETYSFEDDDTKLGKGDNRPPDSASAASVPPTNSSLPSGSSLPDIRLHSGPPRRPRDGPTSGSLGSSVPPLRMTYSLQGEKPLSEKSVERSSNDYDKHLLSKIGKSGSSPLNFGSSPTDKDPSTLPFHPNHGMSLSPLSIGDGPPPLWNNGPPSAAISPGTRPGWTDYMTYRNPSVDSPGVSPMEVDPTTQPRQFGMGSGRRGIDETASLSSRSNRGSYDQSHVQDSDTDFPMDDAGKVHRHWSARERTGSYPGRHSSVSRQGVKRRAPSPHRDTPMEDSNTLPLPTGASAGELEHRRSSGFPFNGGVSPGARYPASHGSVSSVSSASLRTGSYASSTGLSAGASSMSSYDRPSPGGTSPTPETDTWNEKGLVSPSSQKSPASTARLGQYYDSAEGKAAAPRKVSTGGTGAPDSSKSNALRLGRLHICDCCPKKPKKFDTPEELRAHEMEKQYFCRYCNKRFKNKNEAERHQNSLHLRRHSWSCAALSNCEAAFHASATPAYQTANGASHDTCGYCGAEFPNFPQPEWDRRIDHLTTVHKFGECNQAKKFFRADHFRQHLKHSHAGSSGKWTNILENACMREEAVADGGLPSIGEHSGGGGGEMEVGYTRERSGTDSTNPVCGVPHRTSIDEVMKDS